MLELSVDQLFAPAAARQVFGSAQNVDPREAVTSPRRLFTFFKIYVGSEQNLCVQYVPVTADDGAWIQTEDGDYIYSIFL